MKPQSFDQKLQRYAELTVKVALNLQPGQPLFIIAYQLETAPFVRAIGRAAYDLGCPLVHTLWFDDYQEKIRHRHAPAGTFDQYPAWTLAGAHEILQTGAAYLQVDGSDPALLAGFEADDLAAARKAFVRNYKPISNLQGVHTMQWTMVAAATPDWAVQVFPELPRPAAEQRLWEAIFQACRIDQADPLVFWKGYSDALNRRHAWLTARAYIALHFKAPGTDLQVGLPPGHVWAGGGHATQAGISFLPNLPTEEVFTMPHKLRTEGTVRSTKPLHYQGTLIEDFQLTFQNGQVVDHTARTGEALLGKILAMDENAGYLGEIALVPHRSPISQSGLVFKHTLFDENAACHLALGAAYRINLQNGDAMTQAEFEAAGGNDSLIHVDFMFGSGDLDVDGLRPDGTREPVLRAGEWAQEPG